MYYQENQNTKLTGPKLTTPLDSKNHNIKKAILESNRFMQASFFKTW